MKTLYDEDFYGWVQQQMKIIKDKRYHSLDLENFIEEVECLGKRKEDKLENYLERMLICLLKWHYVPGQREKKGFLWKHAVQTQRLEARKLIEANPSLEVDLEKIIQDAYHRAPWHAHVETGIVEGVFPKNNPWSGADLLVDGRAIEDFEP